MVARLRSRAPPISAGSPTSPDDEPEMPEEDGEDSGDEYVPAAHTPPPEPARSPTPILRLEPDGPVAPHEERFSECRCIFTHCI